MENIQRDDLSPLEEAAAFQRLIDEFGHTQEEIAERVGKSRPAVANALRLLRLPESIRHDLARGRLTAGHARVLLSIDDADAQLRAAKQIQARQMSVRDAEQLAAARKAARQRDRALVIRIAEQWSANFRLRWALAYGSRRRGRGGRIEIEFLLAKSCKGSSIASRNGTPVFDTFGTRC